MKYKITLDDKVMVVDKTTARELIVTLTGSGITGAALLKSVIAQKTLYETGVLELVTKSKTVRFEAVKA